MNGINITQSNTPRDSTIESYFKSIYSYPLLTPDEEVELFRKMNFATTEDERNKYRDQIINSNLRFVVSVAKLYSWNKIPLLDLIQQWNVWLCTAVDRFDSTRWFKFISYAVWWIRQSISSYIMSNKYILRVPYNRLNIRSKVEKVVSDFMQQNWYEPTYQQIFDSYVEKYYSGYDEIPNSDLKLVKSIIDEYISLVNAGTPIKLDSAINEEVSANFYEILEDRNTPDTDESLINESLKKIMDKIIDTLSDEQKLIIRKSFSSTPETLVSIADTLWTTTDNVRRQRKIALKKLRLALKNMPDFKDVRDYKGVSVWKRYVTAVDTCEE